MSTTSRMNNASVLNAPSRAYITTGAFATRIFSYATSFDSSTYVTTGTLTALSTGTAVNTVNTASNVAGIVLRETGKKLYPGANPGITTMLVGVFYNGTDSVQGFNGFIDPNDSVFAPFNTDKPYFLEDARSFTVSGGVATLGAADQGASVYSAGAIASTSPTAGIGYAASAGGNITQQTSITTTVTINRICGTITTVNLPSMLANATNTFTVSNSTVAASDNVILTVKTSPNVGFLVNVSAVATNSFNVTIINATGGTVDTGVFVLNFAVIKSDATVAL